MRALLISVIAALALAAPATAQAGWRVDRATQIARIVWHNPNVDRMQIRWGIPPADAESASAWTYVTDGIVWFDSREPEDWEPFCTLVLHEAGHLAGAPHSDHGVMTPTTIFVESTSRAHGKVYHSWLGTDARCDDRGRPYLEAHGAL